MMNPEYFETSLYVDDIFLKYQLGILIIQMLASRWNLDIFYAV